MRVEKAVRGVAGVTECSVNLLTGDMTVEGSATEKMIIDATVAAGYGATAADSYELSRGNKDTRVLVVRLISSLVLSLVLMYFSMGHMVGIPTPEFVSPIVNASAQMLLALAVMIINFRFFKSGVMGVLHRAPNMDTLVSLGSLASFGYSVAMLVAMALDVADGGTGMHYLHGLYFESAAMILALITLGKMLEARAKGKTTDAIRALVSLKGKRATVIRDGVEVEIDVDELTVGDIFIVKPGENIPTDGEVISGSSFLDESMLTGESIPREVFIGDTVYGGTINKAGHLTARATKVGEGTVLASIIKMVKEASGSKAPIAKLADKISAVFVPSVMTVALITFGGWMIYTGEVGYAIARGISVLVISCPCALGLATPVAIMVGSGVGARRGVLFKNAAALEESGRIDTVVLDKTGTLTKGEPEVSNICPTFDEDTLLSVAYSLEAMSEHPLAGAVVKYAEGKSARKYDVIDFKALPGRGVYGKIDGVECYGVSISHAEAILGNGSVPTELADRLSGEGKTPLVFIKGGEYLGIIAVADTLKDDACESISALSSMGMRVVMLSGDNERTALAVARKVGISEVVADVLPDGKEAVIRSLSRKGKVCMVGDGINDAPALTRADVGIAIGTGTDIAVDSADVVIMGKGLLEVSYALGIGRSTLTNIRENLFWAFIYNCLGIPLAAGLFGLSLSPMIGAAMMSLSSFSVVMNALRLNLWRPKKYAANATPCEPKVLNLSDFSALDSEIYDDKEDVLDADVNDDLTENIHSDTDDNEKENTSMTLTIKVEGMMCPHCEARVKKECEAIDGVTLATPSHERGEVVLEMTRDVSDLCKAAITSAGYDVV